MSDLENRVEKLEDFAVVTIERLARIETRLESVERTMATKADLANLETRLIKWFVATAITLTALVFAAVRLVPQ